MTQASKTDTTPAQAERIHMLWDRFLKEGDMAGLACIYAEHATLQSPLVPTFYGPDTHLVCGRDEIVRFLDETVRRRPNDQVHWHRDGYLWNGRTLIWEYPAIIDGGFQVDLAECMDLAEGLIEHHRIYWGWFGVEQMKRSTIEKVKEGRLNDYPLA